MFEGPLRHDAERRRERLHGPRRRHHLPRPPLGPSILGRLARWVRRRLAVLG